MLFHLFLTLCIAGLSCAGSIKRRDGPLPVGIYYNAKDEASLNLIKDQYQKGVWDLMQPNSSELEMDFNPMGMAEGSVGSFKCMEDEDCRRTKIHACAIKMHHDDEVTHHEIFYFMVCTAGNENWATEPEEAAVQCCNQIGTWPDQGEAIDLCAKNNTLVDEYLDEFMSDATAAQVKSVPWVEIDGVYNEDAAKDLLAAVCGAFDGEKPGACQDGQPTAGPTGQPTAGPTGEPSGAPNTTTPDDGSGAAELISNKAFSMILFTLAIIFFK